MVLGFEKIMILMRIIKQDVSQAALIASDWRA